MLGTWQKKHDVEEKAEDESLDKAKDAETGEQDKSMTAAEDAEADVSSTTIFIKVAHFICRVCEHLVRAGSASQLETGRATGVAAISLPQVL